MATEQSLRQALGSRRYPAPVHPIAFGPALEQYVHQVELGLADQPMVFDEVLQVLHEYQAQNISLDVLHRQVWGTFLPEACVMQAHLICVNGSTLYFDERRRFSALQWPTLTTTISVHMRR